MEPKLQELRGQLDALKTEITTFSEKDVLDEAEETRFTAALDEFKATKETFDKAEARAAQVAAVVATSTASPGVDTVNQINRRNQPKAFEVRGMARAEVRDAAMAIIEKRGKHLNTAQGADLEKKLKAKGKEFDGDKIARMLVVSESDEYHSAFTKGMSGGVPIFTPEEGNAVLEMRAANEGTSADGGFGIPVLIDPTIILTSGAATAPILDICQVTTITTDQWKGVTSAGFTWAYGAESSVVADNSLANLLQPTIPVYKAAGFIPYTIEVGDDYPDFQEEMSKYLAQGYLNLVAVTTQTGTGSSQPTGIFTGMQNTTTPAHVTVTTKGALGAVDARSAWAALPEIFRPNATWMMHVSVENQIRSWASGGLALSDYTINMLANGEAMLIGRPVLKSDYAPNPTNTTAPESFLVVGDFSHYRFIQRAGMSVELVPHLFDTSTGRPIGQRGWYAYARHGADADSYNAFRLISNT